MRSYYLSQSPMLKQRGPSFPGFLGGDWKQPLIREVRLSFLFLLFLLAWLPSSCLVSAFVPSFTAPRTPSSIPEKESIKRVTQAIFRKSFPSWVAISRIDS